MKLTQIIILALVVSLTVSLDFSLVQKNLEQTFQQELQNQQPSIRKLVRSYQALVNLEPAVQGLKSSQLQKQLCDKLSKISLKSVTDVKDLLAYYQSQCFKSVDSEVQKQIQKFSNSDSLEQFHFASVVGLQFNLVNYGAVCGKVADFIDQSGSGKAFSKKTELNFENSPSVFEVAHLCSKNNSLPQRSQEKFVEAVRNLVQNSHQLNSQQRGIFEGYSAICTTASNSYFLADLNQYLKVNEFENALVQFLAFVQNNYDESLGLCETYNALRLFKRLQSFPGFELVNQGSVLLNSKSQTVYANLVNPYGQLVNQADTQVQGKLLLGEQVVIEKVDFTKSTQKAHSLQANIETKNLKSAGLYTLQVTVKSSQFSYTNKVALRANAQVSVKGLELDITQSKRAIQNYKYKNFEQGKLSQEQLEANQNSFIHLKFRLVSENDLKFTPKFVAVRLEYPQYKYSTNFVVATLWDKTDNIYKVVIDLGNPDHVLAYNGQYKLVVAVSDQFLAQNINWQVANVDVTFRKSLTTKPQQDTDYNLPKEIHHHFPAPQKQPNFLLVQIFNLAIVFLAVVYVIVVKSQGSNLSLLPTSFFGFISNIAFIVVIALNLLVILLFWTQLNLIQTLTIYAVLFIPTLIIGNAAFTYKAEENQEEKQKQE